MADAMRPPVAEKRPVERVVHGVRLTDDYAWLRADNWQEVLRDPAALPADIRAHLQAENAYAGTVLGPTQALQETLFAELKGRLKPDDSSVPAPDGPYAYYARFREGGQHRLHCRRPREGGEETVLLDGDRLAEGSAFFQMGGSSHSRDHRHLAWSADAKGSELYEMRVLDAMSGAMLDDIVPDTAGGAVWSADGRCFFYVQVDEHHRALRVFRHELGTPAAADALVYEEADTGMFVSLGETQSGRFGLISIHDHETAEVRLLDLAAPEAPPRLVAPREPGVRYEVEHHPSWPDGESLVILTNADGAEDFKVVLAPLADPSRGRWRDLLAHRPGRMILSLAVLEGWLVRLEREDGLPRIVVRALGSGEEHAIAFAEEAYSLGMDAGFEFVTDTLRFTYSSMTTPAETYDYDMAGRHRTLRKRQEVPSGHDPAHYVTRRLMAPAPDGESVPVSLLYRRTTPLDGSAPCLLYGYGAYGISIPAAFSTNALSLVDRGFVYAIAHIRGGTEKGWRWYREGKLTKKPNSFSDFVAAGEHLARERLTSRGRIVAHGGSAGGMLMGAVANLAPDLFGAILAEVPFVDVLATMLDDSLPLTPPEWPEWGNPIADADAFAGIRAYSPVDNVEARAYPPMLVLAGLTDPRVTYWEPAKWVARLRALKTDANPIAFRVNMDAGHGGASGRFDRLKEVALVQAFALMVAGRA
ncbi:S9 family peptidase [Labrys wisconsinensis]|uniref:Oligopeptidase B n=1 Tax=Labrys wisconsinensis TaxID=425677 RepID=A0ABU0J618_9HYPH|nr:S9 family peptidase [Labrys wisconsinensis]MDQ0469705.1 oligopeptidase B [Labrys wisconsinensis]